MRVTQCHELQSVTRYTLHVESEPTEVIKYTERVNFMLDNLKNNSLSAVLAIFPTNQAYIDFSENTENLHIVQSIIKFAYKQQLINNADENLLKDLIDFNEKPAAKTDDAIHTFEDFLLKKDELLATRLSIRSITQRINKLLNTLELELPKVTNSMLTRLKNEPIDTPHKQNVLRSLAFWIGYEKPEYSAVWNFETLLQLCNVNVKANYDKCVRVGFALNSCGDIIEPETIVWMKEDVSDYLTTIAHYTPCSRWGKVKSHDLATFYVDIPKENDFDIPSSYRQCLKIALALSHQISVRWILSKYYTANRLLSIGIDVGNFEDLDFYMHPLLNTEITGDPMIRLTKTVRQYLRINDIRADLCDTPKEISLYRGERIQIWWINGFWTLHYFDFIPNILQEDLLKTNPKGNGTLKDLIFPLNNERLKSLTSTPNAATIFLQNPHHSFLGIEIAKVLFYRERGKDAIDILRILLSLDPYHLVTRTMMIAILQNGALANPAPMVSEAILALADTEAAFVLKHCSHFSEEFYCAYAQNHAARALLMLRHMRNKDGMAYGYDNTEHAQQTVFELINKAIDILKEGMTSSATGIKSRYQITCYYLLKKILESDPALFLNSDKPLIANKAELIKETSFGFQCVNGYSADIITQGTKYDFITQVFTQHFEIYENSTSLPTYRPTVYFCLAVALWDFLPERTVGTVKAALYMLEEALNMARSMKNEGLGIYSHTQLVGRIMPVATFIRHIEKAIRLITDSISESDLGRDDSDLLETTDYMLLTLNF